MRSRAHRRDRLDASFHRMCSAPQDSKCSSQKTDPRECEGYLYPPKKKLTEEALSDKSKKKFIDSEPTKIDTAATNRLPRLLC